jgi:hypothetical protein
MRNPILKLVLLAGTGMAVAGALTGPQLSMVLVGTIWAAAAGLFLFLAADAADARARHDEIAATGIPALVTIRRARATNLRINDMPQLALTLHVEPQDGTPCFECEQRHIVPFEGLGAVHSGRPLHARLAREDRTRMAIDWSTATAPMAVAA